MTERKSEGARERAKKPAKPFLTLVRSYALSLAVYALAAPAVQAAASPTPPALPQIYIDTTYPPVVGNSIPVHAGDDLQAKYGAANCGDELVLDAGATFTGNFTFNKQCTAGNWLIIRTSNLASLPAPGTRVSPSDVTNMTTITSANGAPPITTNDGTPGSYHRFVGLEVTSTQGQNALVMVTNALMETTASQLCDHIFFDRMYVHGIPSSASVQMLRGFILAGSYLAVVDSYISSIYSSNADAQAILGADGPGPYKIHNDYLEGAAENVMFGGTGAPPRYSCSVTGGGTAAATVSSCVDGANNSIPVPAVGTQVMLLSGGLSNPNNWTTIRSVAGNSVTYDPIAMVPDSGPSMKWGLIPQDIEITNNTISKPLFWNPSDPSYDGIYRDVKDLLEMKYGVRWLVNGNWMENTWAGGQAEAVNFNSNDQNGDCPWCRTTDVTFTNNLLKNIGAGDFDVIAAQTYANAGPPAAMARVLIENNLFWPTNNRAIDMAGYIGVGAVGGNIDSLQIIHNTIPNSYEFLTLAGNTPYNFTNFVFRDNIMERAEYGMAGCSQSPYTEGTACMGSNISTTGLWTATNNGLINSSAGTGQDATNAQLAADYGSMIVPTVVTGEGGVGFSNLGNVNNDYHGWVLSSTSPFHNAASDGTDIGVNIGTLQGGLQGTTPMPPSVPTNLQAIAVSSTQINLSWNPSSGNLSVAGYILYRNGSASTVVTGSLYQNTGLTPNTAYSYTVAAFDVANDTSTQSAVVSTTTWPAATASSPPTSVTTSPTDLSAVRIYPNPWRKDKHNGFPITFDQLPFGSTVKIFTVSGHRVKVLSPQPSAPSAVTWNLTNDSESKVASGVYLYLITDGQGNKVKGKVAVIK